MSISNKEVRKRGGELFKELCATAEPPKKLVPIRFPLAEETYEIVQVVNDPIGMVERYILDAIYSFGPCRISEVEDLLGLDQLLIGDLIKKMIKIGADLNIDGDRVSAGDSLQDSIHKQTLENRIKHRRTFVVNPLTGDLLPITHIDDSSRWLAPFVVENKQSESKDWLRVRLGGRAISGSRAVVGALSSTDVDKRQQLGIPEGAIELGSRSCIHRQIYSAIAFAAVTCEGKVEVYSATDFSIRLSDATTSEFGYWHLACHDVQPWVFCKPESGDEAAKRLARNKGVECRVEKEGTLAVSVQNPEKALSVDSGNSNSDAHAMSMLQMDLLNGWYWNVHDFSIWPVNPSDPATESRLVVLRAVEKLRELFRNRTEAGSLALAGWWKEFQDGSSWSNSKAAELDPLELDTLLSEAERVPDTRFLDWLEDIAAAAEGDIW